MKKMLKSAGLVCPHLSRKFTYLMLLLVILIGGANSAWAATTFTKTESGNKITLASTSLDAQESIECNIEGTRYFTANNSLGWTKQGTGNGSSANFSITAESGYAIESVAVTQNSTSQASASEITSGYNLSYANKVHTFSNTSSPVNSVSFKLTSASDKNEKYSSITVVLVSTSAPSATVATPTFSPIAGTYAAIQNVTLSTTTDGATIYYTTDGKTVPTSASTQYTSPIQVYKTTTIQAIAIKDGMTDSDVTSGTFTIDGGQTAPTTTISSNYTFNPTETLLNKILYEDGRILAVGTNEYNSTINGITVKGSGRYLALNVDAGAKIQVTAYQNGSGDRYLYVGTGSNHDTDNSHNIINEKCTQGQYTTFTGTVENEGTIYILANNADLYITQIKVLFGYTVTFNAGTNGTCETPSLKEASGNAGVTLPTATANTGYVFQGWSTSDNPTSADAGVAGATYNPTSDCTLYAYYTLAPKPVFSVGSYDVTNEGYPLTITSNIGEGEIKYGESASSITDVYSSTLYVKNKTIYATVNDGAEDHIALNDAPSTISPLTLIPISKTSDNYDKNVNHVYEAVTLPGTYIAGIHSARNTTGLKLRATQKSTSQVGGSLLNNAFEIDVKEGYKVTKVSFKEAQSTGAAISVTKMYVDGVEVNSLNTFTSIPVSTGSATDMETAAIDARNNVIFVFGGENTQFLADIEVEFEAAEEEASDEHPLPMTSKIQNADFDKAAVVGNKLGEWTWTKTGGNGPQYPYNASTEDTRAAEFWSPDTNLDFSLYQTLSNLPAGTYKLTADAMNSLNGAGNNDNTGYVVLFANPGNITPTGSPETNVFGCPGAKVVAKDTGVEVSTDNYEVYFTLEEASDVTIGFKNFGTPEGKWFYCDNFKLWYYGTESAYPESEDATSIKKSIDHIRTTGDNFNKDVTLLYNGDHNYLRMTAAKEDNSSFTITDLSTEDYDVVVTGDDVITTEKANDNHFYVRVTAKDGVTGTANVKIQFKGNNEYLPKESPEIAITVAEAITLNYTSEGEGTITAKTPGGVTKASGSTIASGTNITFTAAPDEANWYMVKDWYNGQTNLAGSQNTYTKAIADGDNVKVNFTRYYKVNVVANDANYGDVALTEGAVNEAIMHGSYITLSATPKTDYRFVKWQIEGNDKTWAASERNKIENFISGVANDKQVVTLTAVFEQNIEFAITTQPVSKAYNYNATATALSVAATSANELTYQWYSNTEDNNTNGVLIADANEATYIPSTTAVGTTYYYCVVTEGATSLTLTSATAKIDVTVPKPSVSLHENIVTINSSVAGAKYYYTLDKSDPTWEDNPARIEYAPDAVAIRESMTKIRAVTYIDGYYSAIQGVDIKTETSIQYEPVTVLEARGKAVSVGGMFTGNTCTTSNGFSGQARTKISSNPDVYEEWPNSKSPNSLIDIETNVYRAQGSSITIGLNSTSAKKFVIGYAATNSTPKSLSSMQVDGSNATYQSSGVISTNEENVVKRLVITPTTEIEQGCEVTFTFSGSANITYIEVFGTSLEKQCEAPTIVPHEYDATNGWSYQILPVAGTTLNYTVNGAAVQTSTSGSPVTIAATDIANNQIITAWSTKDGWGGSTRTKFTDKATVAPVLKFSPSNDAVYNTATSKWEAGEAPTFKVYPESLLSSVTYETDDETVGYATDGQATITLGSGQGTTKITATIVVADVAGLTPDTYTAVLNLTKADGYADKLTEGYTPEVGATRIVKDDNGEVVLTLGFGGWTHGSNGTKWKNDNNTGVGGTEQNDRWPAAGDYGGDGGQPAKKIDGYKWQSQAQTDARSETKGSIEWAEEYKFVKPYSLPCRGAYITVTPEKNGKLTIYLVQNGCINETGDGNGTISGSPRTYYWFDSEGNCIPADNVIVNQPIYYTPSSSLNSKPTFKSQVYTSWGVDLDSRENSTNKELYDALTAHWANKTAETAEDAIPYQGGYFLMKKAYIKYVVTLLAGKTYYFFSNGSKMGYSGLNFAPSDNVEIGLPEGGTQTVSTVARLALNDTQNFSVPSTTTAYSEATLNRTFKPDTWNTICLPFSVSKEQVERVFGKGTTFIGYNGFSNNTLNLVYHAYDYLLPGQPYFIKPTGIGVKLTNDVIGDSDGNITFNNVTVTSNVEVKDNDEKKDDFQFIGLFGPTILDPYDHYMNGSGNIAFSSTKSVALKGYRAYLKNNTSGSSTPAKIMSIAYSNFDDDMELPTGIESLTEYLESEGYNVVPVGGVYNLNGQKVAKDASNLRPGFYIINGKKVVIK